MLPEYFRSILWSTDFKKVSLEKDRDLILFQVLEKGGIPHLRYIAKKLGPKTIYNFTKKNKDRLSRKSIFPFIKIMFLEK